MGGLGFEHPVLDKLTSQTRQLGNMVSKDIFLLVTLFFRQS